MIKIKSLEISNNLIQAPLAGYSNRAYRHLAIEYGCQLTTTEMISVEGMWRENKNTTELFKKADNEKKICIQLFGSKKESYSKALDILLKNYTPAIIDINAGCPAKKVLKTMSGCAMMCDIENTVGIIKEIKRHIQDIPLSIKFRLGLNRENKNYLEFADAVLSAGVDVITLHPRFASDLYTGKADRVAFLTLREKFKNAIIFASGDVFTPFDIEEYEKIGADAILIARGGIGNPYLFKRRMPTAEERAIAFERHKELMVYYEGEKRAEIELRKFYSRYIRKSE